MTSALTRFGEHCRDLRRFRGKNMLNHAEALGIPVHQISSIETGLISPTDDYLRNLARWLDLNERERQELRKRIPITNNVISFPDKTTVAEKTKTMRLFRKISKMKPREIRRFGLKFAGEAKNECR
jgi:transcriptional regulator with XRE-family HTH domain